MRAAQVDDTTHPRLLAFAAMCAGARGIRRLRRELAAGRARPEAPTRTGSSRYSAAAKRRFPNHRFAPDLEADLYFPALGVVIEVDGPLHDNPTAQADDEAKDARYGALGLKRYRLR